MVLDLGVGIKLLPNQIMILYLKQIYKIAKSFGGGNYLQLSTEQPLKIIL